ncbi:MAG: flagellar hook-basal body protein [Phycisphaerales bacterium]|nr:flagellar hook-basal body protein [Phycisphaerales bacterium]
MNYGLYISTSGMFTALHRMDTAANNLANSETSGFKPDLAATMARKAVRPEDNVWNLPSNEMLENLGGGVLLAPTATNFGQGIIESSASDLHVAIQGDGFMTVDGPDGEPRLTRDGRLAINELGMIVQASSGLKVLDEGGYGIRTSLGAGPITIGADGTVRQAGGVIPGKIALVKPEDERSLKKEGQSLYSLNEGTSTIPATGSSIVQRALERSGVDAVSAMLEISAADRAVTSNGKMITLYDDLMNRAISTFGRLA